MTNPPGESNPGTAEGVTLCRIEEKELLTETNDTSRRLLHWMQNQLVVGTTSETGPEATPPARPGPKWRTTAAAAGYWRNGRVGVVDDTWTVSKEAGIRAAPWRSRKALRNNTSGSGTSCCAESMSRRTRLAHTSATTSTPSSSSTSKSCSSIGSDARGECKSWAR